MEDIKNFPKTQKEFDNLGNYCENIINENIWDNGRDWSQEEIQLFVDQFNNFQKEDPLVDMDKLDPKFIPLAEFHKKFSGFDDSVIEMLYECENKKLEDARIPPLRVKNENVTLTNNLSNITYIDDPKDCKSKTKCESNCENSIGGLETEKKEKEEEEVCI